MDASVVLDEEQEANADDAEVPVEQDLVEHWFQDPMVSWLYFFFGFWIFSFQIHGDQVQVPQWQSDALAVLSIPSSKWTDMDWLVVCNCLQTAEGLAPDATPSAGAPDEPPSSSAIKAPRDWRKVKMAENAGTFPTDFFEETGDPKPYNMNGWRNKMVPLVGAHLRGDIDLANKLAFYYSQNKSLEQAVDEHNLVMNGRSFDPKYGVRSTGFEDPSYTKRK